jgi:phage anti-repressor protein
MNDLITIQKAVIGGEEVNSCSGKELVEKLGIKTKKTDWLKRQIEGYGFEEGVDYQLLIFEKPSGCRTGGKVEEHDYIFTLDTAKELAMIAKTPEGRTVRKYFIEVEKRAKEANPEMISNIWRQAQEEIYRLETEKNDIKRNLLNIETNYKEKELKLLQERHELNMLEKENEHNEAILDYKAKAMSDRVNGFMSLCYREVEDIDNMLGETAYKSPVRRSADRMYHEFKKMQKDLISIANKHRMENL